MTQPVQHQPAAADGATAPSLPPASIAADPHALVITADGSYTPSGQKRTGPVDSVDKLAKLIDWASVAPKGASPQLWIVGLAACELLGWVIDPGSEDDADRTTLRERACNELADAINATLEPLFAAGWKLRSERPGHLINLSNTVGKTDTMLDIILEPYAWTLDTSGDHLGVLGTESEDPTRSTELPEEDLDAARELGRRLAWSVTHLGVLPSATAARTGAAVLDAIRRERKKAKKGTVVDTPGPLPPLDGMLAGELEPVVLFTRLPREDDLDTAQTLVTIDQRASYLSSAGMLDFGYGTPRQVNGFEAEDLIRSAKTTPFGLYRVTLPPGDSLNLPQLLPLPHPHMEPATSVQTWVTAVSLDGLRSPVADGGAGLDLDDLALSEAWIYPHQARVLDKWAEVLRTARKVAVDTDDRAMKEFVGNCYKGYIGRMLNPAMWASKWTAHHHQPVWRAAIHAHARWRGRRAAMRIAAKYDRWPLRGVTDSWTYAIAEDENIDDDSPYLGKMVIEKTAPLTDEALLDLLAATTTTQVRDAIAATFKAGR